MANSSSPPETADQPTIPELETLMKSIKDVPNEAFDQALNIFLALKDIKFNRPVMGLKKPDNGSILLNRHELISLRNMDEAIMLVNSMLLKLLDNIFSPSISEQKMAIKVLRKLIQQATSVRVLFGENPQTIHIFLSLLLKAYTNLQPDAQEDVVPMILSISIRGDKCNKIVGKSPDAIALLIKALRTGSMDSRRHAFTAILNTNKAMLVESGVMEALVKNGVLPVILSMIIKGKLVVEMLEFLEILSSNQEALDTMGKLGAVPWLLQVIRDRRTRYVGEYTANILYSICKNDQTWLSEIREEEAAKCTFSQLANSGDPWPWGASNILEMLKTTPHNN
ncbi:U-box domain-containing protein 9-like [Magnolia sinica]|uniref:U-box domain-containing protein 9-like n=1 Tax=Magnolia sinica TaxID=86752 RepID=UPI002659852B|nr:U-box domain-containing protein 9-like [Magnolia sinica]